MELLGHDGHIYRGRRDGQLPVLMGKEGMAGHTWEGDLVGVKGTVVWAGCPWGASFSPTHVPPGSPHPSSLWSLLPGFPRDKPKLSPRQWDARDTGRLLSRPQSAGSSLSQPGMAL